MSVSFQSINAASTAPCTGVAWGHYMMTSLPVTAAGTDSMSSCFAFIYISRYQYSRMFVMAHVSTDAETQWLVDLNLNQQTARERLAVGRHTWFVIVTGSNPGDLTTMQRIASLKNKYHIENEYIVNNKNSERRGVHVSGAGLKGPIVITSCKTITASNGNPYATNTNLGNKHPVPYLRPMSLSDQTFYNSEFNSGE